MFIFLGIRVVLHLKLLVPTNYMSFQNLGASSQYVLYSKQISEDLVSYVLHAFF